MTLYHVLQVARNFSSAKSELLEGIMETQLFVQMKVCHWLCLIRCSELEIFRKFLACVAQSL